MKNSIGDTKGVKPVVFPHWVHREKYTCKVCHTELGYALKAGTAVIRQADIEAGESCGVCHNGTIAFGANKCVRCHSYGVEVKENAKIEDALKGLPPDDFGNKVNWVEALARGQDKAQGRAEGQGQDDGAQEGHRHTGDEVPSASARRALLAQGAYPAARLALAVIRISSR